MIEANPRASRTVPFVSKAVGRAAGEARLPDHARRADRRPGPARRARGAGLRRARVGQGGGAAVRPLRGRRRGARPGDALDRRGDGHRTRLPDRVRQGAGGGRACRCRATAPPSSRSPTPTRRARSRSPQILHDNGFRIVATRGTAEAIARMGVPVRAAEQDRRGLAARARLDRAGDVDLVVNTPTGSARARTAGRSAAPPSTHGIPCLTTLSAGVRPPARSRAPRRDGEPEVLCLQELHGGSQRGDEPGPLRPPAVSRVTGMDELGAYSVLRVADPDAGGRALIPEPGQFAMLASASAGAVARMSGRICRARSRSRAAARENPTSCSRTSDRARGGCASCEPATALWVLGPLGQGFTRRRRTPCDPGRRRRRDRAPGDPPGRHWSATRPSCSAFATRSRRGRSAARRRPRGH